MDNIADKIMAEIMSGCAYGEADVSAPGGDILVTAYRQGKEMLVLNVRREFGVLGRADVNPIFQQFARHAMLKYDAKRTGTAQVTQGFWSFVFHLKGEPQDGTRN